MKKSLIAGAGVAALAMAAVPFVGVSADVIDTVQIQISSSCSVASESGSGGSTTNLMTATMVNSDEHEFATGGDDDGGSIYVTCNAAGGWNITAQGYSGDTAGTTTMVPSGSGTAIPTAAEAGISAGTSAWGFKVVDAGAGATISTSTYTAVPSNATRVAYKTGAISNGALETAYKVSTSDTQAADTYTGKVKYVVSPGTGS